MRIIASSARCYGTKLNLFDDRGYIIGHAFLYVMHNELHAEPFGLMEDVYVNEQWRGQGLGTSLVKRVIEEARKAGCYKLIATSRHDRPRVHALYVALGFRNQGTEFRIDF